ncbi:hypothetical protein D3C71_649430 [compost metagenome]
MKTLILFALFLVSSIAIFGQVNSNYHYVNGYTRSDGTKVQGHYRTNPNATNTTITQQSQTRIHGPVSLAQLNQIIIRILQHIQHQLTLRRIRQVLLLTQILIIVLTIPAIQTLQKLKKFNITTNTHLMIN